ncbi:MAG TPA: response regulator [Candidatus Saccharimonadales bacterium]|nr:response regulator [Candidatus Saccharimonadales bacterium]
MHAKLSDVKAHILIVDDNEDTRNAIRLTLELESQVNYSFKEANTVSKGLKFFKSFKPNVIILDLHLPGENGFAFLEKLRKIRPSANDAVIVLTADDSFKNLWRAESSGVDAYHFMGKPFEGSELRAQVLGLALLN